MNLLELVILAHRCRSTHHYIAFDALQLLSGPNAKAWKNLLLRHHTALFRGATAPDTKFKDYKNQVLHVEEGEWGGARDAAMAWYGRAVDALRRRKWSKAAYALGVLSHYYVDPIHPFHTAQSEEEVTIRCALDRSVFKSRDTIKALIDLRGYPTVSAGQQTGFVADMVLAGARYSNPYFETLVDHYDLEAGVRSPRAGLDHKLLDVFADLIAYATSGTAVLFDRAFAEAREAPPETDLDLPGYLAALDIPLRKLAARVQNATDRYQVERMYKELQKTGKVIHALPEADKAVRRMHAEQVLRRPIGEIDQYALEPIGAMHVPLKTQPEPVRYVIKVVAEPSETAPGRIETVSEAPDAQLFDHEAENRDSEATASAALVRALERSSAAAAAALRSVASENSSAPDRDHKTEAAKAEDEAIIEDTEDGKTEDEPQPASTEASGDTPDSTETKASEPRQAESSDAVPGAEPEPELNEAKETPEPKAPAKASSEQSNEKASEGKDDKKAERRRDEKHKLTLGSDVVDAPSIGPKTAARLAGVDIDTIEDLLEADPEETANALNVRYINADTIRDWQDQTRLMMDAPGLRVLDSQILVGAGIRSAEDLASATAGSVLKAATNFLDTPGGARVLWGADNTVGEEEVKHWIDCAKSVRT